MALRGRRDRPSLLYGREASGKEAAVSTIGTEALGKA